MVRSSAVRILVMLALLAAALPLRAELSPRFNPQTMLPVEGLQRGMRAVGKSVFQGTRITEFSLEILGVVDNFDLGEPAILAKVLDGPVVERQTGVIQGMSGSPVYVDGKLIGAIAWAPLFQTEPIAGITPINAMLRAWDREPPPPAAVSRLGGSAGAGVTLDGRRYTHARLAQGTQLPPANSETLLLRPVAPLMYGSGFSPRAREGLGQILGRWGITPQVGPGALRDPVPTRLEPGAACGVQLMSGDFDLSGVGTVTYVEGDRMLAFGHPMMQMGRVEFPLTTAWIHDIFPSLQNSVKLGSVMQQVGTLTMDTAWAVAGTVGAQTAMVPVQARVIDHDSGQDRSFNYAVVRHRDLTPYLLLTGMLSALDASTDAAYEGMVEFNFTIKGVQGAQLRRVNSVSFMGGNFGAWFTILQEVMGALFLVQENMYTPQQIESVTITAQLRDRADAYATIERVYLERPVVRAGETVNLTALIRPWGEAPQERKLSLRLPEDTPAGELSITVCGGQQALQARYYLGVLIPDYDTLAGMLAQMEALESNTDLVALAASHRPALSVGDRRLGDAPQSFVDLLTPARPLRLAEGFGELRAATQTPWDLTGMETVTVLVEDRLGRRTAPGPAPPAAERAQPMAHRPGLRQAAERTAAPTASAASLNWLSYPPAQMWWAASGVRPQLAASLAPPPTAAPAPTQPAPEPPGPPGWPIPEELIREARRAAERLAAAKEESPATEDEPEEEPTDRHDGEGRVLRQPSEWVHSSAEDFAAGRSVGLAMGSEGALLPTRIWREQAALPDQIVTCAATGPQDTVYLGAAVPARLWRVRGDQAQEVYRSSEDLAVTALEVAPDGAVLAALAPSGHLLRIPPEGEPAVLCTLPATYVWDLLPAPQGGWWAGTGPHGILYHVSEQGQVAALSKLPADHVLSLVRAGDTLLAGTARPGAVFRVDAQGGFRALLGTADNDVSCLAAQNAERVWAGTAPEGRVYRLSLSGEATHVYEDLAGPVRTLLATDDGVYAGLDLTSNAGNNHAANGPSSGLLLLRETEERTATVGMERVGGAVAQLLPGPQGRLVAVHNYPAALSVAAPQIAHEGNYTSEALDAERHSRWGQVDWSGAAVGPGQMAIQFRSGNTADPDDGSWSAWSRRLHRGEHLDVPAARYLQYRLWLAPSEPNDTALRRLRITYLAENRKPTVSLSEPEAGGAVRNEVTISWSASDEDDDDLVARLYVRHPGETAWRLLAGPLTDTSYDWDTTALEPGQYDLRVQVDDRRSNPEGWLQASTEVQDVMVDNEQPTLQVAAETQADGTLSVSGRAADAHSGIVSVAWRLVTAPGPAAENGEPTDDQPRAAPAEANAAADDPTSADPPAEDDAESAPDAEEGSEEEETEDNEWTAAILSVPLTAPLGSVSFRLPADQLPGPGSEIVIRAIDAAGNYQDHTLQLPTGKSGGTARRPGTPAASERLSGYRWPALALGEPRRLRG